MTHKQVYLYFLEHTDKVLDNTEFTDEAFKDVIVNLDPNEASCPDMISNKMIIKIAAAIAKSLCIIFNRPLFEGIFPDIWN